MLLPLLASATACVIIYANDAGATREIRAHEYAHCNGWQHPRGYDPATGFTKAYQPPKQFLKRFPGNVYEQSVSTREAHERCEGLIGHGSLGCSALIED